jgi:LmbE family N-acetylglucosaminyl deacetylase
LTTVPAGNCGRFAAAPLSDGGTPAAAWLAALDETPLAALDLVECPGLVVVAPHPDDETLGLGATAAHLAAAGVEVQVVSVSDGGAGGASDRRRLVATRRNEITAATTLLGLDTPVFLNLPDGELVHHEASIADSLVRVLHDAAPGSWCAATWRGDGHPDHEAVGRAAAAACARTDTMLLEYPVWMWHWALPHDPAVPWERARAVPVSDRAATRKAAAAQCFRSQLDAVDGSAPVVPPHALQRLLAIGEVVFR